MSDRDDFEKRNPVPLGAQWNDRLSGYYCGSSPSVEHPFNEMWECFCDGLEASRAQQGEGREAVGVIELSDYVQLDDSDFIPRKKALTETSEGSIQNLPSGTKLYTHPAKAQGVPEGWKILPVHATADMVRRGKRAHGEEFLFSQDPDTNIQSIWKAMLAIAPDPPSDKPEGTGAPEVLALCHKCNQEFSVPLESGGNATTDLLCNFCDCPHCSTRNDLWIKLTRQTSPADNPEGEWVKCAERLPTVEDADMHGKLWCYMPERQEPRVTQFGFKEVAFFYNRDETITHWKPTGLTRPAAPDMGGEK